MMNIAKHVPLVILLSVGFCACSIITTTGPPSELKLENLLQKPLADEFTPGREVVVSYVEIPPNMTLDRHWHPGEEFHYYLEGKVEIRIDGEPSITGTPGAVGHVPFKKVHSAIAGDEGAKILVFRVHTEEKARSLPGKGRHISAIAGEPCRSTNHALQTNGPLAALVPRR